MSPSGTARRVRAFLSSIGVRRNVARRSAGRAGGHVRQERRLPHPPAVPAEYLPLQKYLENRYADVVVLTFAQIEDLLGIALPGRARLEQEWWAGVASNETSATQSLAWIQASRVATANLPACIVKFERALA